MKYKIYSQNGLTLIEVMVSLTLGLFVGSAIVGVFIQSKNSAAQNADSSYMQQNGRYALNVLANDLSMSGFFGGISLGTSVVTENPSVPNIVTQLTLANTGCGDGIVTDWNNLLNPSVVYVPGTNSADIDDIFSCVTSVTTGRDVLMVKRAKGTPVSIAANLADGRSYIRTNRIVAAIHQNKAAGTGTLTSNPASGYFDWEYLAHIYYVDNNQLARKTLKEDLNTPSNDPYFQEEVLADGIDVFRIQFGIDSDADGKVDYYTSSPSSTEMTTAVVARIYVLARGESPVRGYTNTKTYQLGDLAIPAFVDGFYRKVFSTSVTMRNPIARQQFN